METMETFQLCRLCLSEISIKDSFVNIFSDHTNFNIRSMLHRYCWFLVLEPDKHSHVICKQCWTIILEFHQFTNRIEIAQKQLCFIPLVTVAREKGKKKQRKQTIVEIETTDLKLSVTNNDNNDYKSYTDDPNLDSSENTQRNEHRENFESNEDIDTQETFGNPITITKIKLESGINKKQFIKEEDADEENDENEENEENDTDLDDIDDDDSDDENIDIVIPKLESEPVILEKKFRKRTQIVKTEEQAKLDTEDALINEYYKRECELCLENYPSMHTLLKHYRRVHQLRGYLRCCGKKLKQRWEAMDHIALHKNPDAFHCSTCNKSYQCHQSLAIHMRQHDPKFERYQCEQCPRAFMKPNSLKWHLLMDHVKKEEAGTFPCDQCNKVFLTDLIRRRHTSKYHGGKSTEAVCAICAKVCQTPSVLKKHHLAAHSEVPKVQCKECDRWFKNSETLRGHQLRHKNDLHTCEICNRQFPNSILFYTHNRRNHTPAKHACVVCNKAFSFKCGLKRHMARHTGQLEKCPWCDSVFMTKNGREQHIKNYHPTETKEKSN